MDLLTVAREYIAAGISLIPIALDGTKAPDWRLLPREWDEGEKKNKSTWKPFQTRLPTTAEIAKWFDRTNPPGIALIGGAVSGYLEQIDFDRDAQTVFPEWCQLVDADNPGLTARLSVAKTPGDGFHVRYRCPDLDIPGNMDLALYPKDDPYKKTFGLIIIQTRGEKGYALAPGCPVACHKSGRLYEHHSGPKIPSAVSVHEREVLIACARSFTRKAQELPKQTGLDLRPGDDYNRRGDDWTTILGPHGWVCISTLPSGERRWRRPDKASGGCSATTGYCKGKDGTDLFHPFTSNADPFEADKSYCKFRTFALLNHSGNLSTAADELARRGFGNRSPKPVLPSSTGNGQVNGKHTTNGHAPKVCPRLLPTYQPFPLETMPVGARGYVREAALALGCDPAYIALPVISVLASVIGNTRIVRLKRSWYEPCVLWTAIIGDSGTLKSPAYVKATAHLFTMQKRFNREYKDLHAAWKNQQKAFNRDEGPDPGDEPARRKVACSDFTVEVLAEILEDNPRGILAARDELAGWIGSFTRYKGKQGGSDLPAWLDMNRAGTIIYDRKTGDRRSVFVERAAVSVTGGIQPGVFIRIATSDLLDSGLVARLLPCMPSHRPKHWTEADIDPATEKIYHDLIDKLLRLDFGIDADGHPIPYALRLSDEAKALWVDYYNSWGLTQAASEGELAAAYSKLEGYAARLALLHHVCSYTSLGEPGSDLVPIGAESMQAGIALARWFAGEERRIYGMLVENEGERGERRLLEYLRSRGGEITARDLWKSNTSRYRDTSHAESILNDMVALEVGEWITRPPGLKGGRPTKSFLLHTPKPRNPETPDDDDYEDDESTP